MDLLDGIETGPSMGLRTFMKRLRRLCPWIRYGYFNPYLGDRAELTAPMPHQWQMPAPDDAVDWAADAEAAEVALEAENHQPEDRP